MAHSSNRPILPDVGHGTLLYLGHGVAHGVERNWTGATGGFPFKSIPAMTGWFLAPLHSFDECKVNIPYKFNKIQSVQISDGDMCVFWE